MKWRLLLQATFLSIALGSTIVAMGLLKSGHTSSFLASLGLGSNVHKLNWCQSRVKTVSLNGSSPITEIDSKWVVLTGKKAIPLDYITFEKWLAKFCLLHVKPAHNENNFSDPLGALFDVEYVNGQKVQVYRLGKDKFQIEQSIFRSGSLEKLMPAFSNFYPPSLRPQKNE